jgi:hypothetical protein
MTLRIVGAVSVLALASGCGSKHAQPPATTAALTTSGAAALQAEATSAAAGDIPDNQVFVTYGGPSYSMKYPEGWVQSGRASRLTFRDKNNVVRVVVERGTPSTRAGVAGGRVTSAPAAIALPGGRAVKVVYRTVSAPSPVTGKRVTLTVDRYTVAGKGGIEAVVDLGTPVGVDNVDAYRMMIESFRWR